MVLCRKSFVLASGSRVRPRSSVDAPPHRLPERWSDTDQRRSRHGGSDVSISRCMRNCPLSLVIHFALSLENRRKNGPRQFRGSVMHPGLAGRNPRNGRSSLGMLQMSLSSIDFWEGLDPKILRLAAKCATPAPTATCCYESLPLCTLSHNFFLPIAMSTPQNMPDFEGVWTQKWAQFNGGNPLLRQLHLRTRDLGRDN